MTFFKFNLLLLTSKNVIYLKEGPLEIGYVIVEMQFWGFKQGNSASFSVLVIVPWFQIPDSNTAVPGFVAWDKTIYGGAGLKVGRVGRPGCSTF